MSFQKHHKLLFQCKFRIHICIFAFSFELLRVKRLYVGDINVELNLLNQNLLSNDTYILVIVYKSLKDVNERTFEGDGNWHFGVFAISEHVSSKFP